MFLCRLVVLLLLVSLSATVFFAADKPKGAAAEAPAPTNDKTLPPAEAAGKMTLPKGFTATLFAGEPDVVQPVAMTIDDRGRLWVCECLSYPKWAAKGSDRLSIYEDTDGDGRFDKKKVFWDQGNYLTGVQLGHGGVWVCCAPHLLFIPDADGDDVPDGPPVVELDGWSTKGVHNVLNALAWGPDGWLYGCNGITAPSKVGRPGAKDKDRVEINCGVWRYHSQKKKFEVVAHGTTNPWGLDWNEDGQMFITNCVIAHLWHVTPGGHYKRMFGNDVDPHSFELLDTCADHLHWGGGQWTSSRGGRGVHNTAGGGHAHSGCMIYQGDNWPDEYRGDVFMCNIHGNRVNRDKLERKGSGYVAKHGADFLHANDTWFRGVVMYYGPDGGVYVTDWNDTGECHDVDDTKKDTGRIFKITYGNVKPLTGLDVSKQSDAELVDLHKHKNEWYVRQARRVLTERAVAGKLSKDVAERLRTMIGDDRTGTGALRYLDTLYCIGGTDEALLSKLSENHAIVVRGEAIRLLCEETPSDDVLKLLARLAKEEKFASVRLTIASVLQRIEPAKRWPIAAALADHRDDANDQNLPLMIWYGIEAAVAADHMAAIEFVKNCQIPQLRRMVAHRIALH